jgi:hypothetical protein
MSIPERHSRAAFRRFTPSISIVPLRLAMLTACAGDEPTTPAEILPLAAGRSTIVPSTSTAGIGSATSQSVANGQPTGFAFDDFTLSTATTVRTVAWQGGYCGQSANAAAPTPTATTFTITIYSDVAGRPNTAAPLSTTVVPVAQSGQTLDKTVPAFTCGTFSSTIALYNYTIALPTPFNAAANTKYWIGVLAATPSYSVLWGWRVGTADNSLALQLFSGTYTPLTQDLAFSLKP